jgi:acetylglutamate kinase
MKPILIKIGGSLTVHEESLKTFCEAIAELHQNGTPIILVHGGGKDINANLKLLEEAPAFVDGLRVTDGKVLDMVEMTLSGHVNKKLVRLIQNYGVQAVGISGCDAKTIMAEKKNTNVDLGFVGVPVASDPHLIELLVNSNYIPIVSPISADEYGQSYNINADEAASAIAVSLQVEKLLFISDVPGVMQNGQVLPSLNKIKIQELIKNEVIVGGMIPKVNSCLAGLEQGIGEVHILGWNSKEQFINHLTHGTINGTIIS